MDKKQAEIQAQVDYEYEIARRKKLQETQDAQGLIDRANASEENFSSGEAEPSPFQLDDLISGGASTATARIAEALGGSKLVQRGAGVAGEFATNALKSSVSGQDPTETDNIVGNILNSAPGALAPEAIATGRLVKKTLNPAIAEEEALLKNPRAKTLVEQEQNLLGGHEQDVEQFNPGGRATPTLTSAIRAQEGRFANYSGDIDKEIGRVGELLGVAGARNNGAKLIDDTWAQKIPEAWDAVKSSGVFQAQTVKELAEKAEAAKAAMYEPGGKAAEFLKAVEGKPVDLEAPLEAIRQARADALSKINHPIKETAEANSRLAEMLQRFEDDLTGAPGARAVPDARALEELNQDINQYRKLDLEEFGPGRAVAAQGSDIERRKTILASIQNGIRRSLDNAGAKAGLGPKAFSTIGQEYGAYDALADLATKQAEEIASSLANKPGSRVLGSTGKAEAQPNAFAIPSSPTKAGFVKGVLDWATGAVPSTTPAMKSAERAAIAPQSTMDSIRTAISLAPGTPVSISPELEKFAGQSRIGRFISPSNLAGEATTIATQAAANAGVRALTNEAAQAIKQAKQVEQTKRQNLARIMPGQIDPYPKGFPRSLEGLDPEIFADQLLSKSMSDPFKFQVAKKLVDTFRMANAQGDVLKREKVYGDIAEVFPEMFQPGYGVNGRVWSKQGQSNYMQRLRRDLLPEGKIDEAFIQNQQSRFNDPANPMILQLPPKIYTQSDVQAQQRAKTQVSPMMDGTRDFGR